MVQENATENRACSGGWGTRATSSGTCRSGVYDYIGTGDVLFYMYNHFTGTETVTRRAELPKAEVVGRETGGSMLTVTTGRSFYYIPGVTDMRCGYKRLLQIVDSQYHFNPKNGDVFIFMSKDCRKVKMVNFENHAYYIHEKCFTRGYRFMKIELIEQRPVYKIEWRDVVSILESPVVKSLRLR